MKALEIPKHFIHGELDFLPADPHNVKILTDSLNNADLEIIQQAGHMFFNKQIWEKLLSVIKVSSKRE